MSKSPLESTWLYHEIGRCYLELQRYQDARDFGEKAIQAAKEAEDDGWQLHASVLVAQSEGKREREVLKHQNNSNPASTPCWEEMRVCIVRNWNRTPTHNIKVYRKKLPEKLPETHHLHSHILIVHLKSFASIKSHFCSVLQWNVEWQVHV